VRVVFDHNVPKRLRAFLTGHLVRTAREMGWSGLENGDLLSMAETAGFDAMVTCDKNLAYQQNLGRRKLALIVLSTNDWNVLKREPDLVVAAVDRAKPQSFEAVAFLKRSR
jgi:hypothetical protein